MHRRPLAPVAMMLGSIASLVALTTLPWIDNQTLWQILSTHGHGYQIAYVVLAPQLLAIAVAAMSFAAPRRWLTGVLSVLMVPPAFLSAVVHHGGSGAKLAAMGSLLVAIAAVLATFRRSSPPAPLGTRMPTVRAL